MTHDAVILCFGEALWDIVQGRRVPGGAPMNVALRLRSYGLNAELLSRVGNDALGDELLGFLRDHGLPTGSIQVDERWPTGTVQVDTSDPNAAQFDIREPVAWDFIDAQQYLAASGRTPDTLVFGSLAARNEASRASLLCLMESARLKVFDVNLRPPYIDRQLIETLLRESDWIKLNESELELISSWYRPFESIESAAHELRDRYGIESLCVTLGGEGAVLLHGDELWRQSAFTVDVVDTVGCGDAFLGTWLAEMLLGAEPQHALRRAAATGALVAASE
ncbi:MAG: carbohydrate kinase, partial [Woeseiaceae bacterium]